MGYKSFWCHYHVTGELHETFLVALLGPEGLCGEAWAHHGEGREWGSSAAPGSQPECVTLCSPLTHRSQAIAFLFCSSSFSDLSAKMKP